MCTWTLRQTSQTDNEFISQVNWDQLHCVRAMVNWWPLQLSKPVNYTYWKMRVHQWIQRLEIKIKLNYWRILLPKLWLKMIIAPLLWQLTSKNSESNRISRDFSCLTSYQTYSNHLHFQFFSAAIPKMVLKVTEHHSIGCSFTTKVSASTFKTNWKKVIAFY